MAWLGKHRKDVNTENKKAKEVLARWLRWLEYHHPIHQKVVSSIPGQAHA